MAVDRKQQMKEITERLEQGIKDIFTSEMYTTYLRTMAKFHNYSFNNTLLIAMQRPDATLVAGFNAWKNKFNRYVKKGEKGIQIIAPAPIKEVEEREKIDKDTGLAVLNENGEPEMERVEYVIPRFRVTTVFDVSQTDGEPIPSLEVNELTASVKDYALLTAAIEQVSPVPMRFDEIEGDAKGYYSDADKEICIQVGMGESQTIKTMIHEVAHTRFAQKIKEAQDKIQEIREKKQEALKHDTLLPTWLEEFKQYEHIKTLERRVVVELIDHIDVHSKTEIEIHFCFEDELHSITEKFMEYQAHHGNEVAEE